MKAPDYKALATSLMHMAIVTGQPSQGDADLAAVELCKDLALTANSKADQTCELYASGNNIVTRRPRPAMPPKPWIVRNPAIERPFVASQLPSSADWIRGRLGKSYAGSSAAKALVMSPTGRWEFSFKQSSIDEAVRRSLERCGYLASTACKVIAIDDTFVVPIPTLAKVNGLYRPGALPGVAADARDEVARRLAGAPNSWNAVAVGAGGHVGIAAGAHTEQSAFDDAMKDCAAHDRNCRIAVLGPFLVEASNQSQNQFQAQNQTPQPRPAPAAPLAADQNHIQPPNPDPIRRQKAQQNVPPPAPARAPVPPPQVALVPDRIPFVSAQDQARIRDEYVKAPGYKAIATSLLHAAFVSGQRTQVTANLAAVEACEKAGSGSAAPYDRICEVYAEGNTVVTRRKPPPMPAQPWIVRNPAIEQPFIAALTPLAPNKAHLGSAYAHISSPKALVIAPSGDWFSLGTKGSSHAEAMRRGLERCGFLNDTECHVVAIDDTFVIPIPTRATAVAFYRPEALSGVDAQVRDEVARRLASAPNAWNAVAVGATGHVGIVTGAPSEQSALDGALADCVKRDRDCRILVLGPFLVRLADRGSGQAQQPAQTAPRQAPDQEDRALNRSEYPK
jgi:hypothetical protein